MTDYIEPTAAEVAEHIYAVERSGDPHAVEWKDAAEYTRKNAIARTDQAMREPGSRAWLALQWLRLARAVRHQEALSEQVQNLKRSIGEAMDAHMMQKASNEHGREYDYDDAGEEKDVKELKEKWFDAVNEYADGKGRIDDLLRAVKP